MSPPSSQTLPTEATGATTNEPALRLSEVTRLFRLASSGRPAVGLEKINLSAAPREIISVVGPSGCGKTTLLRIVAGLLSMDSGDISIYGRQVRGPGKDRGVVFQQPNLLPWRTARGNIEIGLEFQRLDKRQIRAIGDDLLRLIGLVDFADYYPRQLSGGMQQRVGLARALAINPDILLMDEPFSALDAWSREELQVELLRIHAATGKTILFVTHDLDEAIYLSDRVLVLAPDPGHVQALVDIDIQRPREEILRVRSMPQFQEARALLTSLVSSGRRSLGGTGVAEH